MEGGWLLSVYESGGLDAESFCEFKDRGKAWLDLVTFDPDELPWGNPSDPGELLLGHESPYPLLPDAVSDFHGGQYRHSAPLLVTLRALNVA